VSTAAQGSTTPRALVGDALAIAVVFAALCVAARFAGFDHVSDDDFSRVTIAQRFAHAPRLDPSGTSWLPFPFWLLGGVMFVDRSLATAHAASIVFASIAATLPYLALRFSAVPRGRALIAVAFALLTPWSVWLGAATVPESFTASFLVAGAVGLAAARSETQRSDVLPTSRAVPLFASAVAAACLSRYEAWPVAAVLALALLVEGARRRSRSLLIGGVVCAVAPLAWMAWNAYAHDGPLHFFHRVANFKHAYGSSTNTWEALTLYPTLLFTTRPEVAIPALFLLPTLRDPAVRQRWGIPLVCVAAELVFLSYGNARDGAPTHHPERALLATAMLVALFVVDVGTTKLAELTEGSRIRRMAAATLFAFAWVVSGVRGAAPIPGHGRSEDRSEPIARGLDLRARGVKHIVVTPCAYEHFALVAAFAAPENVALEPSSVTPGGSCPSVEER
jgi:hypothetical protein